MDVASKRMVFVYKGSEANVLYNAFVAVHLDHLNPDDSNDINLKFANELVEKVEIERGMRLCIPTQLSQINKSEYEEYLQQISNR